jgi:hypothetical protein
MFASAVAHAPAAALHGTARPDAIAKLHLIELPIYAMLVVVLLRTFGLPGIAMAWTARAILDAAALSWVSRRILGLAVLPRVRASALLTMPMLLAISALLPTTGLRLLFVVVAGGLFVVAAWQAFLRPAERASVRAWLTGTISRVAPTS